MIPGPPPSPEDMPPTADEHAAMLAKIDADVDAMPVIPHDDIGKALASIQETVGLMTKFADEDANANTPHAKARYRSLRVSAHELVTGIHRLNQDVLERMRQRTENPGPWLRGSDFTSEKFANG